MIKTSLLIACAIPAFAFSESAPAPVPVSVIATPVSDPARTVPSPLTSPPFPSTEFTGPVIGSAPSQPSYPLELWLYDKPGGATLKDDRIRVYGWVDVGGNVSTSHNSLAPNSYALVPNSVQLDQAVLRIERQVDTSQTDRFDWGFRVSGLFGTDYRFTIAQGLLSDQLLKNNRLYGFDVPELYGELYFPQIAEGMDVKIGRMISPPDIEAQLSPDNFLYSHSTMFTYDAYTQTGILTTTRLSKQWQVMVGVNGGDDVMPWDPASTLNFIFMVRWDSLSGRDSIWTGIVPIGVGHEANTFNDGHDNYNGYWITWSHKFDETFNMATEAYYLWQRDAYAGGTVNNGPVRSFGGGGGPGTYLPGLSDAFGMVNYFNIRLGEKDYLCLRNDVLCDFRGQRTGYRNTYSSHTFGWSHNLSDLVTFRPEIKYEHAYERSAYDNATKRNQVTLMADVIVRF